LLESSEDLKKLEVNLLFFTITKKVNNIRKLKKTRLIEYFFKIIARGKIKIETNILNLVPVRKIAIIDKVSNINLIKEDLFKKEYES
jgi:hypothetical protein